MKSSILRPIQRVISRRKWLLMLVILPLFIPIQAIKPHHKLVLKIKLNPLDYNQTSRDRAKWLSQQIEILNSEDILMDALKKADFQQDEIRKELTFIKNNMEISNEGDDIINIELVMFDKNKLKAAATEIIDIYFRVASQKKEDLQRKIYVAKKTELEKLNHELKEAKINLDSAGIAINSFTGSKTANNIQQLKSEAEESKTKLYKLQAIYTEEHPGVKELKSQIGAKTKEFTTKELQLKQEHEKELSLSDDYRKKKELYDKISEQYDSLQKEIAIPEKQDIASIIKGPDIIDIGLEKIRLLDLSAKFLFGLALLFLASLVTEKIDKTVWSEKEIRRDLGIRTLGSIARVKKQSRHKFLIDYPKNSQYLQSFEAIRSNIQFINLVTSLKIMLYSSLAGGEDLFAANLAISMSFIGGKICLINLSNDNKKYAAISTGKDGDTSIKNLKILNPGNSDLLDKQKTASFLAGVKEKFDVIIIDSPSITDSVECATAASVSDGVIIGAKSKKTSREYLLRNYKILNDINARVLGVILQW